MQKSVKRMVTGTVTACLTIAACTMAASAVNPFVQSWYTADPAPAVFENDPNTLWVFTSHDEDISGQGIGGYTMKDYKCFTTQDMVNWTYRGTPAGIETFPAWAQNKEEGSAWAQQVVERNGKYYMYAPIFSDQWAWCIGVAVADKPEGPYVDALGEPLYKAGWSGIDPTVFIDNDGQAYMYWGNPTLYCAKLSDDMIHIEPFQEGEFDPDSATLRADGTLEMKMTTAAFGDGGDKTGDGQVDAAYQEGPWFYRLNDTYYMVYPSIVEGQGESMSYSTSPSPTGPWTYQGVILDTTKGEADGEVGFNSYTIHGGVMEFKGHNYLFYHNGLLPDGGTFHRSVAVEEFSYGEDGSIPYIKRTTTGVDPVATLDPYALQQAETIAWSSGVRPMERDDGVIAVQQISDGDNIRVMNVDFGDTGAATFTARVLAQAAGGSIDVYLDSMEGTPIATVNVPNTNGVWQEVTAGITDVCSGVHDVYFVFHGPAGQEELFSFDTWQFAEKTDAATVAAINVTTDKYILDIRDGFNTANLHVEAVYGDGHAEDVTSQVTYSGNEYVEISADGVVTGKAFGDAAINVQFGGKEVTLALSVKDLTDAMKVASLEVSPASLDVYAKTNTSIVVTATYQDGHTEDVSAKATYTSSDSEIADCAAGVVTAKMYGTAEITISYQGEMGEARQVVLPVNVGYRNPFDVVEAEDFDAKEGNVQIEDGTHLGWVESGNWVKFSGVDFGEDGTEQFQVRIAMQYGTPAVELRLDDVGSAAVATIKPSAATGAWDKYQVFTTPLTGVTGVHDVYLYFPDANVNVDWWRVTPTGGDVVDPYERVEAETFDDKYGDDLVVEDKGGYQNVGYISDGNWIKFSNVDFGAGASKVAMSLGYSWYGNDRNIQLRLDDPNNPAAARVTATANEGETGGTGNFENYMTFEWDVDETVFQGKHDLYIYFENGNLNVDWWQFEAASEEPVSYQVKFDANGGNGEMAAVAVEAGSTYTLPECTFAAPSGKQFKAWSVNGEEKAVGSQITVSADVTITAVWEDIASVSHTSVSIINSNTKLDGRGVFNLNLEDADGIALVEVTFTSSDADMVIQGLNGFQYLDTNTVTLADGTVQRTATFCYLPDGQGGVNFSCEEPVNIAAIAVSGKQSEIKIDKVAVGGYDGAGEPQYGTASITIDGAEFLVYDIHEDGVVDLLDILAAQKFYQADESQANWAEASRSDVNDDKVVDLRDLVEILINYTEKA